MATIILGGKKHPGLVALVDECDLARLSVYRWHPRKDTNTFYAETTLPKALSYSKIQMHRLVIGALDGQIVDHINGNGLDNRRANLRIATPSQNRLNSKHLHRNNGTTIHKKTGKFQAQITRNGNARYLGLFSTRSEAIDAYERAAREMESVL